MSEGKRALTSIVERVRRGADALAEAVKRCAREDEGQDLVEYALLASTVGITSYLALNGIRTAVGTTYNSWIDPTVGVPSAWNPPEPPAPAPPAGG